MKGFRTVFYILLYCVIHTFCKDASPALLLNQNNNTCAPNSKDLCTKSEIKLSAYVMQILAHYQQPDPVGIPGAPIPDPMDIPPLAQSLSIGRMNLKDVKLYGLKKFRVTHIKSDLAAMRVEAALTINTLHVKGNYTLSTLFSNAKGPFTANLTKVNIKAIANLDIERNGQLEAQAMNMDITFKDIKMNFQGLGFFASMFQGVMNSVGTFVFDSIKPFILSEVNTNIRKDVNEQLKKFPQKFPNSISPLDQLISEMRRKVRRMGYDPYKVNDYNHSVGIFDCYLSHTWIYGAASFHRTKDIIFELKNNTIYTIIEVGTQKLLGTSQWELSLVVGLMSRAGKISFSVEYIKVHVEVSQTMDIRNKPKLEDIQLELGNIQIRFDGIGTVDYLIELGVNVLPNLIRYQLMDALERPIKLRIQEMMNQVDVEKLIKENAIKLDDENGMDFLLKN